jgi:hypothetical protein
VWRILAERLLDLLARRQQVALPHVRDAELRVDQRAWSRVLLASEAGTTGLINAHVISAAIQLRVFMLHHRHVEHLLTEPHGRPVVHAADELAAGGIDVVPRVRRIVAITPPLRSTSRNRSIAASGDLRYCVPGNELNGIRFSLAGRPRSSATSSRACPGRSLTPSSITYSKVTLRAFCRST